MKLLILDFDSLFRDLLYIRTRCFVSAINFAIRKLVLFPLAYDFFRFLRRPLFVSLGKPHDRLVGYCKTENSGNGRQAPEYVSLSSSFGIRCLANIHFFFGHLIVEIDFFSRIHAGNPFTDIPSP